MNITTNTLDSFVEQVQDIVAGYGYSVFISTAGCTLRIVINEFPIECYIQLLPGEGSTLSPNLFVKSQGDYKDIFDSILDDNTEYTLGELIFKVGGAITSPIIKKRGTRLIVNYAGSNYVMEFERVSDATPFRYKLVPPKRRLYDVNDNMCLKIIEALDNFLNNME